MILLNKTVINKSLASLVAAIFLFCIGCASKEIIISAKPPTDLTVSQSQAPEHFEKYLGDLTVEKSFYKAKEARQAALEELYLEAKKLGGNYVHVIKMHSSSHNFQEKNDFNEGFKTKVSVSAKVYKQ